MTIRIVNNPPQTPPLMGRNATLTGCLPNSRTKTVLCVPPPPNPTTDALNWKEFKRCAFDDQANKIFTEMMRKLR